MKKIKLALFLMITMQLYAGLLNAQSSASEWDYIYVREDIVKPSLAGDYESALTDLRLLLEEHKVKDYRYYTHLQDNYHFIHITPLNKLGEVEKGPIEFAANKLAVNDFKLIWSDLNETIHTSWNYILQYRPELSYAPKNIYWGEKEPYRRWSHFYFSPGTEKEAEKLLKAWKTLYEQKKAESGFRVYSGFVGVEKPLYIFTTWAENPLDFQNKLAAVFELLGDEGSALWIETMNHVRDVETLEGWFLPQYSYVPEK